MKNKFLLIMLMCVMGIFAFFDISKAYTIIPNSKLLGGPQNPFGEGTLNLPVCYACEELIDADMVEKRFFSKNLNYMGCDTWGCKDYQKRVFTPKCEECGEKTTSLHLPVSLPNILRDDNAFFDLVSNMYTKIPNTNYSIYTEDLKEDMAYYVLNPDAPRIVMFDPNKANLYIEDELEDEISTENGYEIYSFAPKAVGSAGASVAFWLHADCSKCSYCGEMVATNGKLFDGNPAELVVSKNCSTHTCGFFGTCFISPFNRNGITIGESWEELECLELVNSTRFCAAHRCGACSRPVVGCNFLDGRINEVATYVSNDAAKYSNYCVNHSCLAYWCKNPNKNISDSLDDGRDGYCSYHSVDEYGEAICLAAGCNNKVVKDSLRKYPNLCASCKGKGTASVKTCVVCGGKVLEDNSSVYQANGYDYIVCNDCILNRYSMDEGKRFSLPYVETWDGQWIYFEPKRLEILSTIPGNVPEDPKPTSPEGDTPTTPEDQENTTTPPTTCDHKNADGQWNVKQGNNGWECNDCGGAVSLSELSCKVKGGNKHPDAFIFVNSDGKSECKGCGTIIDDEENTAKCAKCILGKHSECTERKVDELRKDLDDGKCHYLCCCETHQSGSHIDTKAPVGNCDLCGKKVAASEGKHYCYKCKKETEWKKDASDGKIKCQTCKTMWEENNNWAELDKLINEWIKDKEVMKTCTNKSCNSYNKETSVNVKTIDGELHSFCLTCGYCVDAGCDKKSEAQKTTGGGDTGGGDYSGPSDTTTTPPAVNPLTCTHNYPVPNTVTFTNLNEKIHMQTWTCTNCNSSQTATYDHFYINGTCVCGQLADSEMPKIEVIEPEDIDNLAGGEEVVIEVTDDSALKSITYRCSWIDGKARKVQELNGETSEEIELENLPKKQGEYELYVIELVDEAGNKLEDITFTFVVTGENKIDTDKTPEDEENTDSDTEVNKDNEKPKAELISPKSLTEVKENAAIEMKLSDNEGLDRIEYVLEEVVDGKQNKLDITQKLLGVKEKNFRFGVIQEKTTEIVLTIKLYDTSENLTDGSYTIRIPEGDGVIEVKKEGNIGYYTDDLENKDFQNSFDYEDWSESAKPVA